MSYTYAWTVDGIDISAATDTPDGDDFDKGDDVVCIVTPNDGTDDGDAVSSNTVTILNTAPEVSDVEIDPDPATATDELTCSWTFSDDDDDDDESTCVWTCPFYTSDAADEEER